MIFPLAYTIHCTLNKKVYPGSSGGCYSRIMKIMLARQGFALPTVLIASIIMLIVLLSAATASSSIRSSLNAQYYNQLAREAAESGMARASDCLAAPYKAPVLVITKALYPTERKLAKTDAGF